MEGRGITVIVSSTRYSNFKPDQWWHTRDGARTEIEELQKLLLNVVRHPSIERSAFLMGDCMPEKG